MVSGIGARRYARTYFTTCRTPSCWRTHDPSGFPIPSLLREARYDSILRTAGVADRGTGSWARYGERRHGDRLHDEPLRSALDDPVGLVHDHGCLLRAVLHEPWR